MAKHKTKRYYTRTIDLIFLTVLFISYIYALVAAFRFQILPLSWVLTVAFIIALIFIFFFFISLMKAKRWIIVWKRILITILCIGLGSFGFLFHKTYATLQKMSKDEQQDISVYTVTRKLSNITSLTDLESKTIGFQIGDEKDISTYAQASFMAQLNDLHYEENISYTPLIEALLQDNIQALVMSESAYQMACTYTQDFKENTKIIHKIIKENNEQEQTKKDIRKEAFTVYISGVDSTGSPDQSSRTDTNLLLIINPLGNQIQMISLPRDAYMPNSALQYKNDKLTHTGIYGIETSVKTIENFYGFSIDYYARVSFDSLIEIIDAIGGIDVDVEISFCEQDENRSFAKEDQICLVKGKQHINGKQALAYARHRKTAGYDNPGRERAQQRIIKGVIQKLMNPKTIIHMNALLEIIPNYVVTNMPVSQMASFVSSELKTLQPWSITSISSNNGTYDYRYTASIPIEQGKSSVYLFSQEEVHQVLNAYDGANKQLQMQNFNFTLDELYLHTPLLNYDESIVWDYMAENPS